MMTAPGCFHHARPLRAIVVLCLFAILGVAVRQQIFAADKTTEAAKSAGKVSYYRDVRPILQANCQGCHQPAKAKGGYVMTDFKKLLAGGESEGTAIVPNDPAKSAILKM